MKRLRPLYCVHIGGHGNPGTLIAIESNEAIAYWYVLLGYYVERIA